MNEADTIRTLVILEVTHEDSANAGRLAGEPLKYETPWWEAIGVPDPSRWNQALEDERKSAYVAVLAERRLP